MAGYIARRIGQAFIVVVGVTLLVFVLIHLLPGGPARALLGPKASPFQIHEFTVENGYNEPIFVQYYHYMGKLLQGNLGYSYFNNQTVSSLLVQDLPKTALLVGLAIALALLVAIPLGLWQAVRRNKPSDYILTGLTFIGYSMPTFWLGTLLILAFAIHFHLLPPAGPQGATVGAVIHQPSALVLPVLTLSVVSIAQFSRFVRSSTMENLVQDYVRTSRAKGLSEPRLLVRHVLRNSLMPIITLVGLSLPAVVSGAIITETIFNYPGMGLLFWNAATNHDYPVLMGFTIVVATATVIGSLLADVMYALADPRIRYR